MIEIIATAAVSALASSAVFHRVYSDKVRRLRNSNACRDRKLSEAATLEKQLRGWLDERDSKIARLDKECKEARASFRKAFELSELRADDIANLRRQLASAGKPDTQAVSDYMREIGARGNASPKRAKKADDGWIEWKGGKCPVSSIDAVDVKFRSGGKAADIGGNLYWGHDKMASDIIAYRIVSAEQREAA